ncbi:hypothetical protein GIB67_003212 [Kingdonia uniflora]|uniref:C2 domain-containing protein n=1 Tax=Kingdonia uniflora TaxID=39325 RepID=A0A7J7LGP3_9MAGN|nr:hypothetical protein GIB67_003212 [Kingdonia uniflora]
MFYSFTLFVTLTSFRQDISYDLQILAEKLKLVVEAVDSHDLMPKDGEGSSSPFVEANFKNQRSTQNVRQSLFPVRNQKLHFNLADRRKSFPGRNFIGRARGEEVMQRFQLERKWFFSSLKDASSSTISFGYTSEEREEENKEHEEVEIESPVTNKLTAKTTTKMEEIYGTNDEKSETTQHIPSHQVSHPEGISVEQPVKMHHIESHVHQPNHGEDHKLTDTSPQLEERWPNGRTLGGGRMNAGERTASTYDLVEQMFYLYVRVVKAKDLPKNLISGRYDQYVEVKLGNYKGTTRPLEKKSNPRWNQVFAFSKEKIQSSTLEIFAKEKDMVDRDDYIGMVVFDMNEVPTRVPPDSPLALQWYRLEDRRGKGRVQGEIMVTVWMGTQADEAFSEAWHTDATTIHGGADNIRSKVYQSPKLWYLRVNVIEAQDVQPNKETRLPEVFVKAQIGNQVLKTKVCSSSTRTINPLWNEDLIFVAAEPFEEHLILTVEDRVNPSQENVLGKKSLPLNLFEKRLDHRPVRSRWFNLEKSELGSLEGDEREEQSFSSKIHLRICLEGAYHVLDESSMYLSDQRPAACQLWKQPIGVIDVGILSAQGLHHPMKMKDSKGSTDAYCVAKYGQKWVRTRTVLESCNPKWNEQYTWEVYDHCTVITLGVFDNGNLGNGVRSKDTRIGKVRIRLSALETDRIYTHSYPLLVLHPSGMKKMGELQLAMRFTCFSLPDMMYLYSQPLLPKMHYLHPLTTNQLDSLRYQAMSIVAVRLGRAETPLRKEVVEYMLGVDSHMWSMRRSKANFFRIMSLLSGIISINRWFNDVCDWKNPNTSVLVHVLFSIMICYPELIFSTIFLYMCLIGIWNYRSRPRNPPEMDTRLSWAEAANLDEMDEEFDTFPTTKPHDIIRIRYDRLRSVAGRLQLVVGDMATQGEKFQYVLSWKDPRATIIFIILCFGAAVVLYVTPFRVLALIAGFYLLRHPRFRTKLPSVPRNYFRRLPSQIDSML